MLFGVSVRVNAGECVCLLGRNEVGKSTTLRSIIGLTPPQQGRVTWKGSDLTVWENLDVAARSRRQPSQWTVERVFDLFPKLRELASRNGGHLSGGEQQMLTIARTLMGNPRADRVYILQRGSIRFTSR